MSEKLLHSAWISENLRRKPAPSEEKHTPLIFEAGSDGPDGYLQGHLPGAVYLDLNRFERPPDWNVVPAARLEEALCALGVTHERSVVLYSREDFAAARAALILMYAGVRDVWLLDGNLDSWLATGVELETTPRQATPVSAFGLPVPACPGLIVGIEEVERLLSGGDGLLACVRAWEEHVGLVSGYDYITPRGRIPGSVWAGSIGSRQFIHPDQTTRQLDEIAAFWRQRGLTPNRKITFYCGTGWRASQALFYARLMGWKNVSVYDGGWLEWSANPARPIETGAYDR